MPVQKHHVILNGVKDLASKASVIVNLTLFLIFLFFIFKPEVFAASPSPSLPPSPSPSSSPSVKIISTNPDDNIIKGTSFTINFSVENVSPSIDYYAKFGLDKETEWKGKTYNNDKWFSFTGGGSKWSDFPKFTSDDMGRFSGALTVMTSDATVEGVNNINVKIAKTDKTSESYNSYNSDPKEINIVLPSSSPSPSPSPSSSPSPESSDSDDSSSPSPSSLISPSPKVSPKPSLTPSPSSKEKEASFSGEILGLEASASSTASQLKDKEEVVKSSFRPSLALMISLTGLSFLGIAAFPLVKPQLAKFISKTRKIS